jgi:hypothetical protein
MDPKTSLAVACAVQLLLLAACGTSDETRAGIGGLIGTAAGAAGGALATGGVAAPIALGLVGAAAGATIGEYLFRVDARSGADATPGKAD